MNVAIRPRLAPFGWSIALHVAIAGLLVVKLVLPEEELPPQTMQIEAVIVNQAVLQAAASLRKEDLRRQERQEAKQRQEQERITQIADDKRAEEQRRLEAEQAEQAEQQKEKAAAEAQQRKAKEDAKRKTEADQKRKAEEARQKAERELDLRARLAEEEERTGAAFQSLKAQYVATIQAHVERRWFKPPGTPVGATCITFVTQIPGGEVIAVRFETCGGGEAFRQSIENAIRNASPLPPPPQPALFDREIRLVFRSKE